MCMYAQYLVSIMERAGHVISKFLVFKYESMCGCIRLLTGTTESIHASLCLSFVLKIGALLTVSILSGIKYLLGACGVLA